jgi:hypothetical protein
MVMSFRARRLPGVAGDVVALHVVQVDVAAGGHRGGDRADRRAVLQHLVADRQGAAGQLVADPDVGAGRRGLAVDRQGLARVHRRAEHQHVVVGMQQDQAHRGAPYAFSRGAGRRRVRMQQALGAKIVPQGVGDGVLGPGQRLAHLLRGSTSRG